MGHLGSLELVYDDDAGAGELESISINHITHTDSQSTYAHVLVLDNDAQIIQMITGLFIIGCYVGDLILFLLVLLILLYREIPHYKQMLLELIVYIEN